MLYTLLNARLPMAQLKPEPDLALCANHVTSL